MIVETEKDRDSTYESHGSGRNIAHSFTFKVECTFTCMADIYYIVQALQGMILKMFSVDLVG